MMMSSMKNSLEIFLKYGDSDMAAEHDEIYASETPPEKMEHEDVKALEEKNWWWDESFNCWKHFT